MKKWSGAMFVLALGTILVLCYSFIGKQPRKQSAFDFFNNHPPDNSPVISRSDKVNSSHTEVKKIRSEVKKKPHLLDVEGLDDLYTWKNISKDDSKSLLVWAQMRDLLSRSDALPETAQGIKEAAFAWKELLSVVAKEKASKFFETRNRSNNMGRRDCPYSVSVFNSTISSNGNVLHIPCGLVEDSSITVIGIPDGHGVRFQIDLMGSQFPEEGIPPVILHYNVCMPGDNLTEEPLIVQNTWSNELGWGKEERCPDYGSSTAQKVDGLVKCNEQVIRRPGGGNSNASHPDSDKLTNVSSGSAHASANFPFVDGNPFTATLWAGLEGFHMTVNGRHETSFAYRKVRYKSTGNSFKQNTGWFIGMCDLNRSGYFHLGCKFLRVQNLEPWLVGGVKVAGGLDLISALAKGLPVSEDFDLVIDIERLKVPPLSAKRLVMLIGIFSTTNNFERRMALRRSWMQYEAIRSGNVAVRFFVGLHKNKEVNFHLWKEAQAYGDIQLMPFVDYYSLLTLKTVAICILGTEILPAKYIMKTDDDAFVRIDEVLSSLKGKVSNGLLYGLISFESSPHRDKDNKWYISTEEWPPASYPPWAHGPGYVVSKDIAKFIVQGHRKRDLQLFKLEDVAVGIWIEEFKKHGHKVQYISDERFHNAGCESNYILAHYQNPRKVLCLWEKLQIDHKPECCEDNSDV